MKSSVAAKIILKYKFVQNESKTSLKLKNTNKYAFLLSSAAEQSQLKTFDYCAKHELLQHLAKVIIILFYTCMNKAYQAENTQAFKQFIKQIFEDLHHKTEDLALNHTLTNKTIKSLPISLTYIQPQAKQYQQLYKKILGNLTQYHLKSQGSKIDTQVFKNLVNKKDRTGIMSYMLNCLKLRQQTAQFLTQQLVLGVECKQAIRQVGSQIFKMENPFTSQCKLFIEKAKSVMKNIYQYKKINDSIAELEMALKKKYINRSNKQGVEKYEDSSKAMSDLRTEVENRSKMIAKFLEQLENIDFVKFSIQKPVNFSERLDSMVNIIRDMDNQIKKLQKVKSSYEELKKIQQSHINDINKVRNNIRNKPIVLEAGFQKELLEFEHKIKKHLQDKYSLQENNRYLNAQINCRSNGKLQEEQLIKTLQERAASLEQSLKSKTAALLDSQSKVKLLKNQLHGSEVRTNKSLHQTTSSLYQSDRLTIKQTEEDPQKINRLAQQMQAKERQLYELKNKIKEIQRSLSKVRQQNKRLEHKQRGLLKAINCLQSQKIELKQQCEVLQSQRQRVEAQNQSLLQKIKQLQDHIKVQSSKVKESQHQSSPSQPEEQKNSRSLFTSNIELHPHQSNQLKTTIAENQQLKQQLQHLQNLNFRLRNELQLLRSQKEQLERVDLQNKQIIEELKIKLSAQQNQHRQNRDHWIKTQKKLSRFIAQKEKQISALKLSMRHTQTEFQNTKQNLAQELKTVEIQCDILKQQQFKVKEEQVLKWQQKARKYEKQLFYERETVRKQQKKIRDIQKKVKAIFQGSDKEKV